MTVIFLQVGTPLEEDLGSWGHHISSNTVPDAILQASSGNEVRGTSFSIFHEEN